MSSSIDESTAAPRDARDAEITRLLKKLDEVTQQLFQARDAAVGAEAELGVALAKLREVEHRLHVSTVEAGELREKILVLTGSGPSVADRAESAAGRLSPLLSRTVKLAR